MHLKRTPRLDQVGAMRTTILLLVLAVPLTAAADKLQMKLGLWEMTGDVELGGRKMASPAIQHCVTPKDLDTTWFQQLPAGMECHVDQKVTASTVTWTLDCKTSGGGTMKTTGNVRYTKTTFTGSAQMSMTIPNAGAQTGSMTMSGKYLGACKD